MGLADLLGISDLHCRKVESTKWVSLFMTNPMFRIYSFIYKKFLIAQGSVLVLCTKFNVQILPGQHISHPCLHEGAWPHSLVQRSPWPMPPQLKTKQKQNTFTLLFYNIKEPDLWKRLLLECIYYLGDLEHGGLELKIFFCLFSLLFYCFTILKSRIWYVY